MLVICWLLHPFASFESVLDFDKSVNLLRFTRSPHRLTHYRPWVPSVLPVSLTFVLSSAQLSWMTWLPQASAFWCLFQVSEAAHPWRLLTPLCLWSCFLARSRPGESSSSWLRIHPLEFQAEFSCHRVLFGGFSPGRLFHFWSWLSKLAARLLSRSKSCRACRKTLAISCS